MSATHISWASSLQELSASSQTTRLRIKGNNQFSELNTHSLPIPLQYITIHFVTVYFKMIAQSPLMLLAAGLAIVFSCLATPVLNNDGSVRVVIGSPQIDAEWTDSKFLQCVKEHNGFKAVNVIDDDIALECRGVYGNTPQARDLPSTFEDVNKASCDKNLPKNFEEAAPFRAIVDTLCGDLIDQLLAKGINHITHNFDDAWTKSDSWLYSNKKAILEMTMSLTPETRAALKAGKVAQATLSTLCENGLNEFGTKGEGCTQEIHYYKHALGAKPVAIPIDGAQTTGITNGMVDLFVNDAKDFFGTINLSWSKP
jgi:hypothetical protein